MAKAASTTDVVVAIFASTADKTVTEAASTPDEASATVKAVAVHRLKTGCGNAGAGAGTC